MKTIKVGFDAKRAVCNHTGLGNYSRLVIDVLSTEFPDNDYLLYSPKARENVRLTPLLKRDNVSLRLPDTFLSRKFSSLWRVKGIGGRLRRDGINIFHGLSNELPLDIVKSGIPSVVTIHDLIFRHFPQYYKPIDRKIYDFKFRRAAENATRVIAISDRTCRDLVEMYGIDRSKIDIVYQGCDDAFSRPVSQEKQAQVKARYMLPERYIVAVGTVESRKNQLLAVKAMSGIPDDVQLIIIGRRTCYAQEIDDYINLHRLSRRVRFFENVPFADLPALYAMSQMASYASRFEGFGIPVIEALSAGVPVIAATGSCLEEAGGPGAVYVNPDDVDQYVHEAIRILDDTYLRDSMVAQGKEYIKQFSRHNFANGIMSTYKKVLWEKEC